jgi:hypothetical protein
LNPILSRFCEIYVPEHTENNCLINLHEVSIRDIYDLNEHDAIDQWISQQMTETPKTHVGFVRLSREFYEKGYSCLDFIRWMKKNPEILDKDKSIVYMCFDKIKLEFRCEKLLLLYIFDFLYLRSKKDLESMLTI